MASEMIEAFKDAEKYELYVRVKGYAQGYFIWAILGFAGSFVSYILTIFGEAVDVNENYISFGKGGLWMFIIAFGLIAAFQMDPESLYEIKSKLGKEKGESYQKQLAKAARNVSLGWIFSFSLSFPIVYTIDSLLPELIEGEPYLTGIMLALAMGNLFIFISYRDAKASLIVGLIIILALPLGTFALPYQELNLGLAIGFAYYVGGFYIRFHDLPRVMKVTNRI